MPSRRLAVLVTVVIVVALAVVAVAPAFAAAAVPTGMPAHSRLVESTPADGSTVETATEVRLQFNEDVNPDFVTVEVTGADGAEVTVGDPEVDGRTVTQALADPLPAGKQTVAYRVVSADGHPISGTLSFTTTAPPPATPEPTTAASPTVVATPAPSPTEAATPPATDIGSTPASDDGGDTSWALVAVLAVLVLVAAGVAWSLVRARRSGGEPGAAGTGGDGAAGSG